MRRTHLVLVAAAARHVTDRAGYGHPVLSWIEIDRGLRDSLQLGQVTVPPRVRPDVIGRELRAAAQRVWANVRLAERLERLESALTSRPESHPWQQDAADANRAHAWAEREAA